jgi:hypothetical protein
VDRLDQTVAERRQALLQVFDLEQRANLWVGGRDFLEGLASG